MSGEGSATFTVADIETLLAEFIEKFSIGEPSNCEQGEAIERKFRQWLDSEHAGASAMLDRESEETEEDLWGALLMEYYDQ